jgi:hypothetical protein
LPLRTNGSLTTLAASREAIAVQRAYAAINVGADVDELTTTELAPAVRAP